MVFFHCLFTFIFCEVIEFKFRMLFFLFTSQGYYQTGKEPLNNVISTSMRRHDVASTPIRRCLASCACFVSPLRAIHNAPRVLSPLRAIHNAPRVLSPLHAIHNAPRVLSPLRSIRNAPRVLSPLRSIRNAPRVLSPLRSICNAFQGF